MTVTVELTYGTPDMAGNWLSMSKYLRESVLGGDQLTGRIGRCHGTAAGALLYSLGSFTAALLGQAFNTWVQFYYVDTLKMPLALYATGWTLYGIWNAINDPLAGQWSDNTRTRWGRRIPFILFGTIPFCIAFALVWWVPGWAQTSSTSLFAYFLVASFLFDGLFTVVILNWTALYPEMYPSLAQRSNVSALRQALGIVGMIIGMVLAPQFREWFGWTGMGILFAVIGGIGMFFSLLGSKENLEFTEQQGLRVSEALRYTFLNKSFVTFVLTSLLVQFTFVLLTATMPFFCKYVLGLSDAQNTLMLAPIFVVALPMVWVWGLVTNRIGPRRTAMLSTILFALALVPFRYVTTLTGGMITSAFVGIGLAGLLVIIDVLIADVVDEDELNTGTRREGAYFGANAFVMRLGVSLQAITFGIIMGVCGYDPDLALQPATVARGLRILMTAVPIISLVLALVALYFYPIDEDRREAILRGIQKKREVEG
jgi:GPH family glycoside/pentoside/hexuronide:cation symporter